MKIEVTILHDDADEKLYDDTKTLLQHLDLSKLKDMKDHRAALGENEASWDKRRFSRSVRKGYEFKGVNITVSKEVMDDPSLKSSEAVRSFTDQALPLPLLVEPPLVPKHWNMHSRLRLSKSMPPPSPNRTQPPSLPVAPVRGTSLDDASTAPRVLPTSVVEEEQRGYTPLHVGECRDCVNEDLYTTILNSPWHSASTSPSHKTSAVSDPVDAGEMRDGIEFLRHLVTSLREDFLGLATTVEALREDCKRFQQQLDELATRKDQHSTHSMHTALWDPATPP